MDALDETEAGANQSGKLEQASEARTIRRRAEDWKRHPRPRSSDGKMNLCGLLIRDRRIAAGISRPEFIKTISNVTDGRWSPSEADLVNVERQTRTVTDIELMACAAALGIGIADLVPSP